MNKTCEFCKYWKKRNWVFGECSPMLDGLDEYYAAQDRTDIYACHIIPHSKVRGIIQGLSGKDFGCIHWEVK